MEDYVALVHKLRGDGLVVDGFNRVMKTGIAFEMLNVLDLAC